MDSIREAMYLGLGAISLTKKKAEEIIDDLVKRGEMSANNRAATVEQLLKEAELQKNAFEGKVTESVQKVMVDLGLPTQKDFDSILRRLDGMEKAIGTMKRTKRGKKP
jgi:polyhydroxyalkanoate synthesis regulator phasin